jgi:hypothetical protein
MLNLQRVFTLTQKLLPLLRAGAAQGGRTGIAFNDPSRIINVRNSFFLTYGIFYTSFF